MGRCVGCRKQTQNFCHVHQEFVCVYCLVDARGHARCHVGSYRDWVNDSSYPWPPKCVICSEELVSDDGVSRLLCLAIAEDSCLANKAPEDGKCPHCETSLIPSSTDTNSIASHLRSKLQDLPWVKEIAPSIGQPPPERGEPIGTTTNAKGDVTIDFGVSAIQERAHGDKVSAQNRGDVPEIDVDDKQQKAQQEKGRRLLMSSMRYVE
uniref:ZFPL1-like B-box zinc-binding domain-containing protein n=1 Tax=Rhodosorus marinus TaxID=101924 RepID=A0A7S2ZKC9_9RHOD|mmetsp:Transcript_22704/g.90938  ORF Transcript_22704/g.90938 Transcript_22704/m.90938 type:complete len:208 (+) Transcript_22704:332-955(+)